MVSAVGIGRRVRVRTQQRMVDRLECRDRPPRPGRQRARQISTESDFLDRYRCRGLASEDRSRPDLGPEVRFDELHMYIQCRKARPNPMKPIYLRRDSTGSTC